MTGLLVLSAGLAVSSLVGDSITFDETSKLTSGVSCLQMGDFRLAPDHPPLAKMWTALPMLFLHHVWPGPHAPGLQEGNVWQVGRTWLCELNDGQRLVVAGRLMMVVLLVATCLCIYALGRALFGPAAGLLALVLAALSPTLLAHGRLVTTDLPAALYVAVVLLTFARLLRRVTALRLVAAALAITAFAVVKFSWPLILPAMIVMAVVAVLRREPMELQRGRAGDRRRLTSRGQRTAAIACIAAVMMAVGWLGVWTCYRWRYNAVPAGASESLTLPVPAQLDQPPPSTIDEAWNAILQDEAGEPACGVVPGFVRWARRHRLLPEAYLFGLAYTHKTTGGSPAYLCGEVSLTGWTLYFPIAFAIKTPVATMLLLIGGIAAIARRRARVGDLALLAGLVCFAIVYALFVIVSRLNIGQRHLLPIYPAVFVIAGASAAWWSQRVGRWLVVAAVGWLVVANLWIHPHYLCYFNELIGGPSRGHKYLADSNIDWGQDLLRLADYARRHPDEPIKLAYFGSVEPTCYDINCQMLPSFFPAVESADLTAGTYVISVTQLLGVYDPLIRDEFWTPASLKNYRALRRMIVDDEGDGAWAEMRDEYDFLRRRRLINQLQHRPPDERIGYSLFVYRLTQVDVDALTRP